MKQLTKINFKGQRIYIGIDVHLRSWSVSIYMDDIALGTKSFPPSAKILGNYFRRGGFLNTIWKYEGGSYINGLVVGRQKVC